MWGRKEQRKSHIFDSPYGWNAFSVYASLFHFALERNSGTWIACTKTRFCGSFSEPRAWAPQQDSHVQISLAECVNLETKRHAKSLEVILTRFNLEKSTIRNKTKVKNSHLRTRESWTDVSIGRGRWCHVLCSEYCGKTRPNNKKSCRQYFGGSQRKVSIIQEDFSSSNLSNSVNIDRFV